jgi:hypothetical protein
LDELEIQEKPFPSAHEIMSGRAEGMKCILESGLNGHIFGNVVPKDILSAKFFFSKALVLT